MKKFVIYVPYFIPTNKSNTNGFLGGSGVQAYNEAILQKKLGQRVIIVTLKLLNETDFEIFENIEIHRVGLVNQQRVNIEASSVIEKINSIEPDELLIFYSISGKTNDLLKNISDLKVRPIRLRFGCSTDFANINLELSDVINSVENILINTSMLKSFYKKFPEAPVRLQPNFANKDFYSYPQSQKRLLRDKFAIDQNSIVFLFAGRLVKQKGIEELIEIFSNIAIEKKCIILFVGDDRADIQKGGIGYKEKIQLLEKLIPNRFRYLGVLPNKEMPSIYNIADYFCLPTKVEGMSNSLIEALSCEVNCLVSDIPENNIGEAKLIRNFKEEILQIVENS